MMDSNKLKKLIEDSLADTTAMVESDDNVHFSAIIVSSSFDGIISKVKQQQMVYSIINDYIASGELHAIAMKTYTPAQWQSKQGI